MRTNHISISNLTELLKSRQEHKIIIGDFNLTLDVDMDRLNTYCNNNNAKEEVINMMDQFYLKDVWRVRNLEKREYSWTKKSQGERKASRIDNTLISGGLDQYASMIMYISSIMTDHRAIYIVLDLAQTERGTGYWKTKQHATPESRICKVHESRD